jgi:hypothetical protein
VPRPIAITMRLIELSSGQRATVQAAQSAVAPVVIPSSPCIESARCYARRPRTDNRKAQRNPGQLAENLSDYI